MSTITTIEIPEGIDAFVNINPQQSKEEWIKAEEGYKKSMAPLFAGFAFRKDWDKNLPPSAIPNCPVWFKTPKYKFGDQITTRPEPDKPTNVLIFGWVMGMAWDEEEWEYTAMGEQGCPLEIMERDVLLFDPCNVLSFRVYRYETRWVFDDSDMGLEKEALTAGMDTIIDRLTVLIPNADDGFIFKLSDQPFPGYRTVMIHQKPQNGGNWYYCPNFELRGWLCNALYKYYEEPPSILYLQAMPSQK